MGLAIEIIRLAATYSVISLGFIVVYRTSRVLNLAHPAMVMVAGYIAALLLPAMGTVDGLGPSFVLPLVGVLLIGVFAGIGLYFGLIRHLTGESRISIIMMSLAILFLLEAVARFEWQGMNVFLPLPGSQIAYEVLSTRIRLFDLIPIAAAILVFVLVVLFYQRSRFGTQMRAVAENATLAARRGIDIDRVGALSWALAGLLAVIASLLMATQGPVSPLLVDSALKGFTVALVGGLDSILGAVPASLLVAASEVIVVRFVDQQLGQAVPFLVLLAALLIKPWGLGGTVEELDRV